MTSLKSFSIAAVSALALSACGGSGGSSSGTRDFVRAVGSSTVYPFATAVAEEFAKSGAKSPVIESTGTGAGMKLFCAGVGAQHPDIENASRRMKASEYADCAKNGVTEIVEIQVGIDGIAFGEAKDGPGMKLAPVDVYKALAANPFGKPNTANSWKDVNPALPDMPIMVYGPPSTSGTRDALAELILEAGCKTDAATKALKDSDEDKYKAVCTQIREDGAYVDSGENDNLIVQKISQNPKAIGIFGFSFLEENPDTLKGIPMSGIEPTYETISNFTYPGARPLYIYVKKAHLAPVKGLAEYVKAWPAAWGPDGYLKAKGMVIAPEDVRKKSAEIVAGMTLLDPSQLK
ncbi:substrate-binding domain-containing protein [Novosphingobium album (ex Liu et al. 2023)]|uniref:Substrate-binding domain-containing protein n=1 Tax=Novosphingobium album (ex Liu et al. 2023) TaxID=3031130 RepID=A0ABT5WJE0_9SPHN|nr:substrate-binding domain-containing protein [Novosphingobium album (ex Liu et al. 2023)]MDE8650168.1 substrate-binding domain-containing protein [Novosphingobium album (ex Liu et al. 2023)]